MPRLPVVKPKAVLKKLRKKGFLVDHTTGSHYILYREGHPNPVTLPTHNKDLKPGTIHAVLEQSGLTIEEFLKIK